MQKNLSEFLKIQNSYLTVLNEQDTQENVEATPKTVASNPADAEIKATKPLTDEEFEEMEQSGAFPSEQELAFRTIPGTGTSELSRQEVYQALDNNWDADKRSTCIFGERSAGKSSVIREFAANKAKELGLDTSAYAFYEKHSEFYKEEKTRTPYIDVMFALKDKSVFIDYLNNVRNFFSFIENTLEGLSAYDFRGVPDMMASEDYDALIERKYGWIVAGTLPGATGVIFMDEINRADETVSNALMPLYLDKTLGGRKLSSGMFPVGAGNLALNPEKHYKGTNVEMLKNEALLTRFARLFLVMTPEDWFNYAEKTKVSKDIIDFIRSKPYQYLGLQKQKEGKRDEDEAQERGDSEIGFPSTRNVEFFDKNYKLLTARYREKLSELKSSNASPNDIKDERIVYLRQVKIGAMQELGDKWAVDFENFLRLKYEFKLEHLTIPGHPNSIEELASKNTLRLSFIPTKLVNLSVSSLKNLSADLHVLHNKNKSSQFQPQEISKNKEDFLANADDKKIKSYNDMLFILEVLIKPQFNLDKRSRFVAALNREGKSIASAADKPYTLFSLFIENLLDPTKSNESTIKTSMQKAIKEALGNLSSYESHDEQVLSARRK
jgi:hypothetical protein